MIRLMLSQLRHSPAVFIGPLLTAAVTAVFVQLAAVFWWSVVSDAGSAAFAASGDRAGGGTFSTLGLFILVFGVGLPAIIAFTSVGRNSVSMLRSDYAHWRLAGVTPPQIVRAVISQTVLLTLPASLLALLVSLPSSQAAVSFVMTLGSTQADIPVSVSWQPLLLSIIAALGFALLGAVGPGIRAARIAPIEALRASAVTLRSRTILRLVLVGVLLLVAVLVAVNVATAIEGSGGASMLALVGILTALVAAAGPMIYPSVTRLWTLILLPAAKTTVFLARRSSTADGTAAAAVITPVLIAGSLLSGYFSGAGTYKAAVELIGRDYTINLLQGLILFGPAAVIGLVAGIMSVIAKSGPDERAAALLRTVGATPRTLILIPLLETAFYAVTTLLLTAAIVFVPTALYALGFLNAQGLAVPIIFDLRASVLLTACAAIAVFIIRAFPALRTRQMSLRLATA
ncbi:MAG: hypothetical protein QM713_05775 [Arachnia sp.]